MTRVDPIPAARLDPDQLALHREMTASMQREEPGVQAARADGALLGPFAPMLQFPQFGRGAWEYTKRFMGPGTLADRVRQVAILAVAARTDARFEIHSHEIVAETTGLTSVQVATLAAGERPSDLDDEQTIAYAVARTLVEGRQLPESTYRAAVAAFTEDGTAELIFLVGSYVLLAIIINGYDLPVPEREATPSA